MKAQPLKINPNGAGYVNCEAKEATHLLLSMPGPLPTRILPIQQKGPRAGTPNWTWNGSTEKPTLKPSILSNTGEHRCHTYVTDGHVRFLSDCSHKHAGKTLPLLNVE